ncbi:MAG TPA: EamA family transporter [Homoserinimonas sp.]|nr:EamA family transporter [Homoserinimonas sp.]
MSTKRDRTIGAGTQIFTEVSINFGSALAGLLIPIVGVVAIVTARQLMTAIFILPFYRPKLRELSLRVLWPALALGVVLAVMNFTFYESVGRLGLGIAATIEFLGPLTIALAASRRLLDFACAIAAGAGVVLLTGMEGDLDLLGVLFALLAAASWAAYILLTRRVATQLPGLEGLSIATVVALVILLPIALFVVDWSTFSWFAIGLLVAGGILSSALPYSLDTFILRRITPRLYAIITSCGPAIAAAFGVLILSESLGPLQVVGIAAVCAAAGVAIATQRDRPTTELEASAHTIS